MSSMAHNIHDGSNGRTEELAFLRPHAEPIAPRHKLSLGQGDSAPPTTGTVEHKAFFRQGYKPDNSNITKKLFIVLRGLPGSGSETKARGLMADALDKNVKTIALLSTEDFFLNEKGEYIFDKDRMTENHRRNYDRSVQHFILGTEMVMLNNYNIKKSHYRHYVQTAVSMGYDVVEVICGSIHDLSDSDFRQYHENTHKRVPEAVIRNYAKTFEP